MPPEMRNVWSSHIERVGYDEEARELHIVYANGSHVVHRDVPPEVGRDVLTAPSIGSEVWRSVRGRFGHTYHTKAPARRK